MNKDYNVNSGQDKSIRVWLILCLGAIICMIVLGGVTRLTNSGLSIVEWKPITGIIPPITDSQWQMEFSKYQLSPEYQKINLDMAVNDFKFIFWLEFLHRLAGRVVGILYILPLLWFIVKKRICTKNDLSLYAVVSSLFLLQGYIGWYMVKSGLSSIPHVSHFRLALHLMIAVVIYSLLFWQLVSSNHVQNIRPPKNVRLIKTILILALMLLYCQITFGAFVAGLKAGLIYNSFPFMGGYFIPLEIQFSQLSLSNFSEPIFVQFIHRIGAYSLWLMLAIMSMTLLRQQSKELKVSGLLLITAVTLQLISGIFTLLYNVPIIIAVIHQIGAVLVLSCLLFCLSLIKAIKY